MKMPLNGNLTDYFSILIFMGTVFGLSLLFVLLSFLRGPRRPNAAKLSPYECGFEPFSDARLKFDVRFYLIAILFLIFDLEIAFLFPWAISLMDIGLFGYFSMMVFLLILTIGFIYEWRKGALEWE
ncbi:MAG: NADH-quinone oxidoreductase subunit A [Alphaproteobacteria bacterium]|nr:NADH-quinone oxidoreductase subunit A [Alphaproteobacteria bacterium]